MVPSDNRYYFITTHSTTITYPCILLTQTFRSVPCPPDGLCLEEDNPSNVISGHQLTYRIQDPLQPRYVQQPCRVFFPMHIWAVRWTHYLNRSGFGTWASWRASVTTPPASGSPQGNPFLLTTTCGWWTEILTTTTTTPSRISTPVMTR